MEFSRARLPADLPPDGALEIDVGLMLPDGRVPYVLKVDLVNEGICWFEDAGSKPVYVAL